MRTVEEIFDNFWIILRKRLGTEQSMVNPAKCRCCVKQAFAIALTPYLNAHRKEKETNQEINEYGELY